MKKDLYEILGVKNEADSGEIKRAYRTAAKRSHPDVSGEKEGGFRSIREAYEILSDPVKRRAYDRSRVERRRPVIQGFEKRVQDHRPPLFDHFTHLFSAFDPLFWGRSWITSQHEMGEANRSVLEVVLSPQEARTGGDVPLEIPLGIRCGRCHGHGRDGGLICGRCRGIGGERAIKKALLSIPPGVREGAEKVVHLELPDLGILDIILCIKIED